MKLTKWFPVLLVAMASYANGEIVEKRLDRFDDTALSALRWLKAAGENGSSLIFEAKEDRGFLEFIESSLALEIPHNSLELSEFNRAKDLLPNLGFTEKKTTRTWQGQTVVTLSFLRNFDGNESEALEVIKTILTGVFLQKKNATIMIEKLE
jgi:hypothetical protein